MRWRRTRCSPTVSRTGYGLGVDVKLDGQRRQSRRTAARRWASLRTTACTRRPYCDRRIGEPGCVAGERACSRRRSRRSCFEQAQTTDDAKTAQARAIFTGLQQGRIDRSLFTSNANFYFSDEALGDFKASLGPLGAPESFEQTRSRLRGGMTGRRYEAKFADRTLRVWDLRNARRQARAVPGRRDRANLRFQRLVLQLCLPHQVSSGRATSATTPVRVSSPSET